MSHGWTKKYLDISFHTFFEMMLKDRERYKNEDKVLYFKVVVKTDKCTHEHRSILKNEVRPDDL